MQFSKAKVENFKAICSAEIELAKVNILVGQNSSGKTSFLQAMHWAFRCVSTDSIKNNQVYSTSAVELDFAPTLDAKTVGHNANLREGRSGKDSSFVNVNLSYENSGELNSFNLPIKRGRNETVQIDLRRENKLPKEIYELLKDKNSTFSAFIPGLAGIPKRNDQGSLFRKLLQVVMLTLFLGT